jgi:deoxyadenosine/deoxycytidine kinase
MSASNNQRTNSESSETSSIGSMSVPAFVIAVEGNIACGKSTLLEDIASAFPYDVEVHPELVNQWRDLNGHNLLQNMYENPTKNSMAFQMYAMLTFKRLYERPAAEGVVLKVVERSVDATANCFMKLMFEMGNVSAADVAVYKEWQEEMRVGHRAVIPDLTVYIRCDPEVAYERLKQRSRNEEVGVKLDYLQRLHELHDEWLLNDTYMLENNRNVVVLDGNQDAKDVYDQFIARVTEELRSMIPPPLPPKNNVVRKASLETAV